jgi:hypothetical protein
MFWWLKSKNFNRSKPDCHGKNGMLPFKYQLTEQQIRNMVRFIRDLQKENF